LTRDGRSLITAGGSAVRQWDPGNAREQVPLLGHTAGLLAVTVAADGLTLATAAEDSTVRLWDIAKGKEKAAPDELAGEKCYSLTFEPDGRRLAAGLESGKMLLWDPQGQPKISQVWPPD